MRMPSPHQPFCKHPGGNVEVTLLEKALFLISRGKSEFWKNGKPENTKTL
jgi:hypothetical protein